jgi:hypothetical protein
MSWLFDICASIYNVLFRHNSNAIANNYVEDNYVEDNRVEDNYVEDNFSFNEKFYASSIINVESDKQMFDQYIISKGRYFLFRNKLGEIWIVSTHFDRHKKLDNGLVESLPPTKIGHKPKGKYLWSSFIRKCDWFEFIVNEKGGLVDFFMGDVYLVATKLNDSSTPICFIDNSSKLAALNKKFGVCTEFDISYGRVDNRSNFDWPQFYRQYGSLIILDYHWKYRLSIGWYYGFDCTTGINFKIKSIHGFPVVKVQKLKSCEINRLFYSKIGTIKSV